MGYFQVEFPCLNWHIWCWKWFHLKEIRISLKFFFFFKLWTDCVWKELELLKKFSFLEQKTLWHWSSQAYLPSLVFRKSMSSSDLVATVLISYCRSQASNPPGCSQLLVYFIWPFMFQMIFLTYLIGPVIFQMILLSRDSLFDRALDSWS